MCDKDMAEIIMEVVSNVTCVHKNAMKGKSHKEEIVIARKIFAKITWDYTELNKSEIARMLNRNHATIIHYKIEEKHPFRWDKRCNRMYADVLEIFTSSEQGLKMHRAIRIIAQRIENLQIMKKQLENVLSINN